MVRPDYSGWDYLENPPLLYPPPPRGEESDVQFIYPPPLAGGIGRTIQVSSSPGGRRWGGGGITHLQMGEAQR
jgi:hypothetical protein